MIIGSVSTARGAKTAALDAATGHIDISSAQFEAQIGMSRPQTVKCLSSGTRSNAFQVTSEPSEQKPVWSRSSHAVSTERLSPITAASLWWKPTTVTNSSGLRTMKTPVRQVRESITRVGDRRVKSLLLFRRGSKRPSLL
jgi:hypothetical protein